MQLANTLIYNGQACHICEVGLVDVSEANGQHRRNIL